MLKPSRTSRKWQVLAHDLATSCNYEPEVRRQPRSHAQARTFRKLHLGRHPAALVGLDGYLTDAESEYAKEKVILLHDRHQRLSV